MEKTLIPKILHQTWKNADLPGNFRQWRGTWLKHHPGWTCRFYADEDCLDFIRSTCPDWLAMYTGFKNPAQRADLFRYLVVLHCGGVYADMDMECFKPLDPILEGEKAVFGVEAHVTKAFQRELGYREPCQVANCIFGAAPGHIFLKMILARIKRCAARTVVSDTDVEDITGPRMVTRIYYDEIKMLGDHMTLLPQIYLMSPHIYPRYLFFRRHMYARHHCAGTWKKDQDSLTFRQRLMQRNRLPWIR